MANDKPGLRKTFTTKTRYGGKLHYDKMSAAQLKKMISSSESMLAKLEARKKAGTLPKPKRKPKRSY